MSATVTVDREALRRLLFEVNALGDVEWLRAEDGLYAHHIYGIAEAFERTIDPREGFDEDRSDEEACDAEAEVRGLHARHLFRALVIEDMLSHA